MVLNRRLESMAVLGIGGMVYTFLGLWIAQSIVGLFISQRMLQSTDDMFSVFFSVACALSIAFTLIAIVLGFAGWQGRTIFKVGFFWMLFSFLEWFVSNVTGPATLLTFFGFWAVFGLAGGFLTSPAPDRNAPRVPKPGTTQKPPRPRKLKTGQGGG